MTPYERIKGKKYGGDEVEFGERVHYKYKKQIMANKLEHRWGEGFYLGRLWRSGEAILGTSHGIEKAGTIDQTNWSASEMGRRRTELYHRRTLEVEPG